MTLLKNDLYTPGRTFRGATERNSGVACATFHARGQHRKPGGLLRLPRLQQMLQRRACVHVDALLRLLREGVGKKTPF